MKVFWHVTLCQLIKLLTQHHKTQSFSNIAVRTADYHPAFISTFELKFIFLIVVFHYEYKPIVVQSNTTCNVIIFIY